MIGEAHDLYPASMIFDGIIKSRNMYHSAGPCDDTPAPGIKITFGQPIEFADLVLSTRTDCCRDRYNNVCLYADDIQIGCTPSNLGNPGNTIYFKDYVSAPAFAKKFRLMWENGKCMQIAELYFHYKGFNLTKSSIFPYITILSI